MRSIRHFFLVLLVIFIWGVNFVFLKLSLNEIPPFLLCAVRFILVSVPAIFFVKPPETSIKVVVAYGLIMFALQFACLFVGLYVGMTPGMASVVMQVQVFFSLFFAAMFLQEKQNVLQLVGAVVSFLGIILVAEHLDGNNSLTGLLFILAAAASSGVGNLISKKIKQADAFSLIVWGSFIAIIPLMMLSYLFEGPSMIMNSYHHLTLLGLFSVGFVAYASTWVGYGLWSWLLSQYPVSTIAPFALLVPVIGLLSSVLFLKEPFQLWKLLSGLLVITGLCVSRLNPQIFRINREKQPELN